MIDISKETTPQYYTDYEECLKLLQNIKSEDYEYPEHKSIFHTYTEIKDEKELMVIKSFLATQDLDHCELWVWSDYSIEDNPLIQPYKDLVTFKVYDPIEEAKGTPLENYPEYLNLPTPDKLIWIRSDILRLLLGYKYGGTWIDMDIIFLRNFKPLLDQEYAYVWGSDYTFKDFGPCGTVLSLFKESELSNIFLEEIVSFPLEQSIANYKSLPVFSHPLFLRGYNRHKYTVFPSVLFNTEWQINVKYPGHGTAIESGWFTENEHSTTLFTEAFAWHWHNNSYKHTPVEKNSKFDILTRLVNCKLEDKGIL